MKTLKRQSLLPRIDEILRDIARLEELATHPVEEFAARNDTFALAQFYLRQALEGVFHIGSHILSRLPGGRATEYKEIARLLGERGIVPLEFAQQQLMPMAGYRTRLTHSYYDVGPEEVLGILRTRLSDLRQFLDYVRALLVHPEQLGLQLE